jgi:DNA ligase (NAD+)
MTKARRNAGSETLADDIRGHASPLLRPEQAGGLGRSIRQAVSRASSRSKSNSPSCARPIPPRSGSCGELRSAFQKVRHEGVMLSLDSLMAGDEVARVRRARAPRPRSRAVTYVAEPKFDGLSVELVYEDGVFGRGGSRAATARSVRTSHPNLRHHSGAAAAARGEPRRESARHGGGAGEALMPLAEFAALNKR